MSNGLASIVFPVDDLEASKPLFTALLGVEPHTDTPYYVGYNINGLEIALNPHAKHQGQTSGIGYWSTAEIDAEIAILVAAGATVVSPPAEVGGGTTIATVADPAGNVIGLITGPGEQ
jgi:predicted enzyme related to lactoylglutathione lyase